MGNTVNEENQAQRNHQERMAHINIDAQRSQRTDEAKLQIDLETIRGEKQEKISIYDYQTRQLELDSQNKAIDLNHRGEIDLAKIHNEGSKTQLDSEEKIMALKNEMQMGTIKSQGELKKLELDHDLNLEKQKTESRKADMEHNFKMKELGGKDEMLKLEHQLKVQDNKLQYELKNAELQSKHELALENSKREHELKLKAMEREDKLKEEERLRAIEDKKVDHEFKKQKSQQEKNLADLKQSNKKHDLELDKKADFFAKRTKEQDKATKKFTAETKEELKNSKNELRDLDKKFTHAEKQATGLSKSSKSSSASSSKQIEEDVKGKLVELFGSDVPEIGGLARRYSKCKETIRTPLNGLFKNLMIMKMKGTTDTCRIELADGCNGTCVLAAALTALQEDALIADCGHDDVEAHNYLVRTETTGDGVSITEVRPNPSMPN